LTLKQAHPAQIVLATSAVPLTLGLIASQVGFQRAGHAPIRQAYQQLQRFTADAFTSWVIALSAIH